LPWPPSDCRRRSEMETVSETTLQLYDFVGVRGTGILSSRSLRPRAPVYTVSTEY